LIAGVATHTLEIFEEEPAIDTVIVPLGGGSGAAGAAIVKHSLKPQAEVIAVQSEQAPAAYRSWKERRLINAPNETIAEGLATGQAFELPQRILWDLLDDFDRLRGRSVALICSGGNISPAQLRQVAARLG
jgi:threonine dehydratase